MPDPQSTINHDQQATAPSSSESCEESAPEAVNSEVSLSSPLSTPHIRAIMRIPDSHVARMPALTLRELLLHGIFVDADGGLGLPMGPWPLERLVGDETTPEAVISQLGVMRVRDSLESQGSLVRLDLEVVHLEPVAAGVENEQSRAGINRMTRVLAQLVEDACSICTEKYTHAVTTNCGHVFCLDCVRPWVRENEKCPVCRKSQYAGDLILLVCS